MTEYIEKSGLVKRLDKSPLLTNSNQFIRDGIIDLIEKQPTADVVAVVRCKNCKFAMELTETEELFYTNDCVMCSQIHPDGNRIAMLRNSFCSYGERKDSV